MSDDTHDCPNCEALMNFGEQCPECEHHGSNQDCSCVFCASYEDQERMPPIDYYDLEDMGNRA